MIDSSARKAEARYLAGAFAHPNLPLGELELIQRSIEALAVAGSGEQARDLCMNPKIERSALLNCILDDAGLDEVSRSYVESLCQACIERKTLEALPEVAKATRALFDQRLGIVQATITLPAPSDPVEASEFELAWRGVQADMEQAIAKRHGFAKARLLILRDPELMAGAKISIGDLVIELSAKSGLAQLREALAR